MKKKNKTDLKIGDIVGTQTEDGVYRKCEIVAINGSRLTFRIIEEETTDCEIDITT